MTCQHDCLQAPAFPAEIANRPALDRIGYRIGDYGRFRAHLFSRLDEALELRGWTHRGADDPGIALLECGAIAGEILAFYQELYANETYLRTARWRESVARLVALGGYRLAPGLGGQAQFALEVTGTDSVTVPAGFGFKADLDGAESPSIFESLSETTIVPWLSRFHLYRPRLAPRTIEAGANRLELSSVDGQLDLSSREAEDMKPGDRLIVMPHVNPWEAESKPSLMQPPSEILIVKEARTVLDRIVVEFEGKLTVPRGVSVDAYKIGRSFRHFGHNAPSRYGILNETTGIMEFQPTEFERSAEASFQDHEAYNSDFYTNVDRRELPLDTEVDDLATGGSLVLTASLVGQPQAESARQARTAPAPISGLDDPRADLFDFDIYDAVLGGETDSSPMTVVRQIDSVRQDTLMWGGQTGGATVVTLADDLVLNEEIDGAAFDIRGMALHEVIGPRLTFRAESRWDDGDFDQDPELTFFGRHAEVVSLAGRELLFEDDDGVLQPVRVTTDAAEFDVTDRDADNPWLWTLRLDQPPRYRREAFDESDNRITVYGNLVLADEGETQSEAVLGNGDARLTFQTFGLPKAPLTYLLHNERTPPQVPELEIYVDDLLWQRVEIFFNSGPTDRVYVVREDEEGNSLVQFGDGKAGARLPSGTSNVRARYRMGGGAYGALESGKTPKALGRLQSLSTVWLPQPATGGAPRETEEAARDAAPARLQSLGRLVGLADYEAEALALPGVRKARGEWVAPDGVPRLRIVVLTDGATESEAQAIATAMDAANRCRGAARFVVDTVQGVRQYVHLNMTVAFAADRLAEDIDPAVRAALGVEVGADEPQQGLFGFRSRQFGQGVHVSQVIAPVQQIPGVVWVSVDAFQIIPLGRPPETDPLELTVPATALRREFVDCSGKMLLALHDRHLYLNLVQEIGAAECET